MEKKIAYVCVPYMYLASESGIDSAFVIAKNRADVVSKKFVPLCPLLAIGDACSDNTQYINASIELMNMCDVLVMMEKDNGYAEIGRELRAWGKRPIVYLEDL